MGLECARVGIDIFVRAELQSIDKNRGHDGGSCLAAHAFGTFRQLLEAVTLNPAMGYYLNTKGNLKENTATGRQRLTHSTTT